MNRSPWLFGELRAWHFLIPGILAYAVPLFFYAESLGGAGILPAVGMGFLAAGVLMRLGCRFAARPLEYGNGAFALLLAGLALLLLLQSATEKNPGLAYISFILACVAAMWRLGAGALTRSLIPFWIFSLLFMPFVCSGLETFSLEVWSAALLPASHALDYFLVPNDVADSGIRLTQGRLLVVADWVAKGFALNTLVFCLGLSILRGRSFFFAFFVMASSLVAIPVLQGIGLVAMGILVFHFDIGIFPFLIPVGVGCGVVVLNLVLHTFGRDKAEWIWKSKPDSGAEAESVFEGCDLGASLFAVLLLFVLSGLTASFLLITSRP